MKYLMTYILITFFGISSTLAQKPDLRLDQKAQIKNKKTVIIQEKNETIAFNEADLFQMYYPNKKKDIQTKKKMLFRKIKKGNKQAERELKELKVEESKLNKRYKKALKFSKLNEQIYFKIGPIPPCPRPRDCGNDWLRNLETIIIPASVKNFKMEAVNKQGQTIGFLNKKRTMFNKNIGFKTYQFKWKSKPKGAITFKVRQQFNNNLKESYEVSIK